eukprot:TRINITY_DN404_c0_g1_i4.p1 TRINITY_DN404_c0_g1~~TRINITY_DN404_c0_g1_i4.p1  ORF type:complete len:382 (-),score=121.03 TRINITY_DN404_c0_g1_i4:96-1241(-)
MNYEDFENMLNVEYEESAPKLLSRVDSCPPTPCRNESSSEQLFEFECSQDLSDPVTPLSVCPMQETGKLKIFLEEDRKESKAAKALSGKISKTCNKEGKNGVMDKKALRAERNRKFAKESRDRKRKYIETLEQQVTELKRAVEYYKQRLKKYELIDKYNSYVGYEIYDTLAKVHKEMQEKKLPASDSKSFTEIFIKTSKKNLEEQKSTLRMLTKEMLQILIPFPKRLSMWSAEQDLDPYNPEQIVKYSNSSISLDQAKLFVEYTKKIYPEKKLYNEVQLMKASMAKKVRSIAKELIGCQKKIHYEYQKMDKYFSKRVIADFRPELMEVFAKIVSNLAIRPEVRNYGMESMNEIDYGVEHLSLENAKDIEMTTEQNQEIPSS